MLLLLFVNIFVKLRTRTRHYYTRYVKRMYGTI